MTNKEDNYWVVKYECEYGENYVKSRPYYICSNCGFEPRFEGKPIGCMKYCPECGSKINLKKNKYE